MGVLCGAAAIGLGMTPAVALTGAALAAVIRVLAGDAPAQLAAAAVAPVLAVASFAEAGGESFRAAVALATAGWAITELARPPEGEASPLVLVAPVPACIAAVLDPSFVALVVITGIRLYGLPVRPRWVLGVPVVGALAIALAVAAGTAWPGLGARWFGGPAHAVPIGALAMTAAVALGPLTAVAAIAGLSALFRARLAELAIAAAVVGAVLVDVRAGALGPATIGLAALLAGLAIGRLAALIRIPSGQAMVAAMAGMLMILPPAWTALARRTTPVHAAP